MRVRLINSSPLYPSEVKLAYTGHERDTHTTLDYMRARYYDAAYGRFNRPDPAFDFDPANPSTFNLYSYARGNPTNYIDPAGAVAVLAVAAVALEGSLTALDIYNVAETLQDPSASSLEAGIAVFGLAAGVLLPLGGYSLLSKLARRGITAADAAQLGARLGRLGTTADKVADIAKGAPGRGRWLSAKEWARDVANEVLKKHKESGVGTGSRSGQHGTPHKRAGRELQEIAKTGRYRDVEDMLPNIRRELERLSKKLLNTKINHPGGRRTPGR